MGKIQTYGDLASFFRNTSDFLLDAEFENNLFWEVCRNFPKNGKTAWFGNVFLQGKISHQWRDYAIGLSSSFEWKRMPPFV